MALGDVIARLSVSLGLDTIAFEKGATLAEKRMAQTQRKFEKLGRKIGDIGKTMSLSLTAPILGAGAAVVKMTGDFELAMNKVSISTQGSAAEMKAMSDLALKLGKDTLFGASEAADAMDMLAKNGLNATQILNGAAEAAVNLATAGGAELAPAADAITDVMQQFKISVKDLPMVVDQITGAVNESKLDFEDFAYAIGQGGGVAGAAGVEFQDFNAVLAGTSSLFASGQDAGTSFKTFLTSLPGKSSTARGAIEELGLQFYNADGSMRSMSEIAQELQEKLGGLSDVARQQYLTEIFGTDAMRTAVGLMDLGAAGLDKIKTKIQETDAAAQSAKRMEGFNGQLDNLKGAVETLAIRIGESGLLEALTDLVSGLSDFIDMLSETNPEILKWGTIIAGVVAVIGPLLVGISAIVSAVGVMLPAIVAVGSAIGVLSSVIISGAIPAIGSLIVAMAPILLPLAAIAAAVAAVYYAWKNWDAITAFVQRLYQGVKKWLVDKLGAVLNWVNSKVKAVEETFAWLYDRVVGNSWIPDMVSEVGDHMAKLDSLMVDPATKATQKTDEAFRALAGNVSTLLDRLFPKIAELRAMKEDLATIDAGVAAGLLSPELGQEARFRAMGGGRRMEVSDGLLNAPSLIEGMDKVQTKMRGLGDSAREQTVRIAKTFKDMADETASALARMSDAIKGGGFLDILQGVLGLGLQLGSIGVFGSKIAGNINKSVPGYATGTNFHPGGLAMVGERGPELVSMPRGSRVFTNRESMGMMGGGQPVVVQVTAGEMFDARVVQGAAEVVKVMAPGMVSASSARARMDAARPVTPGGATG